MYISLYICNEQPLLTYLAKIGIFLRSLETMPQLRIVAIELPFYFHTNTA